jgi:hypothetical protein
MIFGYGMPFLELQVRIMISMFLTNLLYLSKNYNVEHPESNARSMENQYSMGYYLADGIYPEWAVFVKSIILPISDKDKIFAQNKKGRERILNAHLEY